jgi:glycosyltransferase involved in cell wall biosynthesis
MIENEDIIIVSEVDYYGRYWLSRHHIASRLARHNRVLFVQPRVSLLSLSIYGWSSKFWRSMLKNAGVKRETDGLFVLQPFPRVPFDRTFTPASHFNQALLAGQVRMAMRRLRFDQPILWCFAHNSNRLIGALNEKLAIYHCVDNWEEFPWATKRVVRQQEDELTQKADLVFTTARALYGRIKTLNQKVYLIPNGVDVELFSRALSPDTEVAADIACIARPIIGFMGQIEVWLDIALLTFVATTHPEWSVVLIGSASNRVDLASLRSLRNVHLLGWKEPESLPGYLRAMDVCTIPFKINELTLSVSPLKLYEYLASGRPVVSVDLPDVDLGEDIVQVARDREDFVQRIEKLLRQGGDGKAKRVQAAIDNSWDARMETYSAIIQDALGRQCQKALAG